MGSVSSVNGSLIMTWITVAAKGPERIHSPTVPGAIKNICVTAPEST